MLVIVVVAVVCVGVFDRVFIAVVVVAVTPEQEFFENEEERDAGDQGDADFVDLVATGADDGVRDETEQRRT